MLTLSKPISAGQAQAYHKSEFANAKENYYTEGERVRCQRQGQLAERWGLKGEVNEEQFARLSDGQHPMTGEALIRRQQAREYVNQWGETVRTMEHRSEPAKHVVEGAILHNQYDDVFKLAKSRRAICHFTRQFDCSTCIPPVLGGVNSYLIRFVKETSAAENCRKHSMTLNLLQTKSVPVTTDSI